MTFASLELSQSPPSGKSRELGSSLTGVQVNGNRGSSREQLEAVGSGRGNRSLGWQRGDLISWAPCPTVLHRPGTWSAATESPLLRAALPASVSRAWPVTNVPVGPRGTYLALGEEPCGEWGHHLSWVAGD